MSTLLYIILSLLSINYYKKGKLEKMLLCLTMIQNSLFGFSLALGESSIKPIDYLLGSMYAIIALAYSKDHHLFDIKKDEMGDTIKYCFLWTFIVFLGTLYFKQETPVYAFKLFRAYLLLPFYFVIRGMKMPQIEKYIKLMVFFSAIQGVFFYLQLVGITGFISGYGADVAIGETIGEHRFGNYPAFASFFFVYFLIKKDYPLHKKLSMLAFWGMMPVIGQMRGAIMALTITSSIYFIFQRKAKNILYIALAAILLQVVVSPVFASREENYDVSTVDELKSILKNPFGIYKTYEGNSSEGTFVFRIAMYEERIAYMIEHPKYLLEGVGCIHEDSPNNKFRFNYGTTIVNEDGRRRISMLASADITWVGVLMHFGLVGVILFTILYYKWTKIGLSLVGKSKNDIFIVYSIQSVGEYLNSYDGSAIGRIEMFYYIVAFGVIALYLREQEKCEKKVLA